MVDNDKDAFEMKRTKSKIKSIDIEKFYF
jgi:hypothetical protein